MNRMLLLLLFLLSSFVSAQTEKKVEYGALPLGSEMQMDFAIIPDYEQYGSASTFYGLFEEGDDLYVFGDQEKELRRNLNLPLSTQYIDEDILSSFSEITDDGSIRYIDLDKSEAQLIKQNEMNSGLKKLIKEKILSKSEAQFKKTTNRGLAIVRFSVAGAAVFTAVVRGPDFPEMIQHIGAGSAYGRAMILALATVVPGTIIQLYIEKFEKFTQTYEYENALISRFKAHLPKVHNAVERLKISLKKRNTYFKAIGENGIVKTLDKIRQNIIPNWTEAGKWQYTEYAISGAILLAGAQLGFETINGAAILTFLLITKITALTQGNWEIHAFQAREAVEKLCASIEEKANQVKNFYEPVLRVNNSRLDNIVLNAKRLAQLKMSLKALMGSVTWSIGAVLGMSVPAEKVSASELFSHIPKNEWVDFFSTALTHKIALFSVGESIFYTPAPSALMVFGVLGTGAYLTSSHFSNLTSKISSKISEAKVKFTCNKIFSKF